MKVKDVRLDQIKDQRVDKDNRQITDHDNVIAVYGAKQHNLKGIDIKIPRDQLVVVTGLSGSGKSSLVFDTIYAEGQRRYIETFSAYARQFLGNLQRPKVDQIEGLSPVIAIEQKTITRSPRSTVGTVTEIYDFLRLLYTKVAQGYSYKTGELMVSYTDQQIQDLIVKDYIDQKVILLAPVVRSRKGNYKELFVKIAKQGFTKVCVDGIVQDIVPDLKLDRYKNHDIEIVIDRMLVNTDLKNTKRLTDSIQLAMRHGQGILLLLQPDSKKVRFFSRDVMCPTTGIAYPKPQTNTFSFNSPKGACSCCSGLGILYKASRKKIIPDKKLSIANGGLAPYHKSKQNIWILSQLEQLAKMYQFSLDDPIENLTKEALDAILYGVKDVIQVSLKSEKSKVKKSYKFSFEGIANFIETTYKNADTSSLKRWALQYMDQVNCPQCKGSRLQKESLYFRIDEKNIDEVVRMDLLSLQEWVQNLPDKLSKKQNQIAHQIIKEIATRLQFLVDVGLSYLTLSRSSQTLSGGESQRIRLATQIGSQLVGVLYILDEPSIGLHQRDNQRLIQSLVNLRDIGNSVLVVEHDKDMILKADHVIDIGPKAGKQGGNIVSQGTPAQLVDSNTLTASYITGKRQIEIPKHRRKGNGQSLVLYKASGNNLKNVTLEIPLGTFTVVTGVSGSGKSSLINGTLYPILNQHFYRGVQEPLPFEKIEGIEHLDKVIDVNQSPIGRTPRSNPATYTGIFSEIRALFAKTQESQIRGYKAGRFSFNVKGGRCETCQGAGIRVIEMNFLPDVQVPCESCQGKRFNRETLEVRYKGKSIADVLEMKISQAVAFFEAIPKIHRKLRTLEEVGLGYIALGQSSTTLSGGEAQRIKLATELSKRDTGKTLYILDEPTTGLHFEDVNVLLSVLQQLVDKGNTVLVIEHQMDVIKVADHIIDIGYEGGVKGGKIIAWGTPEKLVKGKKGYTAEFLALEL